MKSETDVKIAMTLLYVIVFVSPSRIIYLTVLKRLIFHYILGALIQTFAWLIIRQKMTIRIKVSQFN